MHDALSFRLRPWLAVYALTAACLTSSKLLELHSADSLIYSLGSLDHWTPFFWEQDRVGMLVPLLTSPLRNPLHNLLAQTFVMTLCGLLLPLLLVRWLIPTPTASLAAAVANAWFLLAAPDLLHENQFIVCMYPAGMVLGIAGLLVLDTGPERWRWPLALALLILGMWTYLAIVVILFPLAVLNTLRTRRVTGPILVLFSFAVGFAMMKLAHNLPPYDVPTSNAMLPWKTWPASWRMFLTRIVERDATESWLLGLATAYGLGIVGSLICRHGWRSMAWAVLLLLIAAGLEIGFCGSRKWVSDNLHHPRYIIVSITALPLAAGLLVLQPLAAFLNRHAWVPLAIGGVLLAIAGIIRHGLPGQQSPRAIFDDRFGKHSQLVLGSHCDAVGANYWDLWTTYFHLRMSQYPTEGPVPFPVGWRSWEYRPQWHGAGASAPFTVVIPGGMTSEVMIECVRRGLEPLTIIEHHDGYDIAVTRWQPGRLFQQAGTQPE